SPWSGRASTTWPTPGCAAAARRWTARRRPARSNPVVRSWTPKGTCRERREDDARASITGSASDRGAERAGSRAMSAVVDIADLEISFATDAGTVDAVTGVTLQVQAGE